MIVGIGFRAGISADAIVALVARALDGRTVTALATIFTKAGEPGLVEAAARLNLPVLVPETAAIEAAQARCATRSARVRAATGFESIAEAAALAAAGPGSTLVLARITDGAVTVALAR